MKESGPRAITNASAKPGPLWAPHKDAKVRTTHLAGNMSIFCEQDLIMSSLNDSCDLFVLIQFGHIFVTDHIAINISIQKTIASRMYNK
jgi:hypothetical protein